jgi:hypothetical protein
MNVAKEFSVVFIKTQPVARRTKLAAANISTDCWDSFDRRSAAVC